MLKMALPKIKENNIVDFMTGDVRTILFNGDASLVPVLRTTSEMFTDTALNAYGKLKLDAVVNGEQY